VGEIMMSTSALLFVCRSLSQFRAVDLLLMATSLSRLDFKVVLIVAAVWNRAGHCILACCFFLLSSFFLSSFFPRLMSAAADWMSTILVHMVWP